MILNTNNLPWFISSELRTIINYNISEYSRACVLNIFDPVYTVDSDQNYPVKIAIDTDGTLIMISSYLYLDGPPLRTILLKLNFDFAAKMVSYYGTFVPLSGEQKRFRVWENDFVDAYRRGIYKVKITPIYEVERFG